MKSRRIPTIPDMPAVCSSVLNQWASWLGWLYFQVNQNDQHNKGNYSVDVAKYEPPQRFNWSHHRVLLEVFLVFLVLSAFAFTIVPGVNESHYLTKAKQFWNPNWCIGDVFLESADAHYLFYLTCGWPTIFTSLDVTAWTGRVLCWIAFAFAWVFLNHRLSLKPGLSVLSAAVLMLLSTRFDMAGEWVVGGFEAKSITYVFVIVAIAWYANKQLVPMLIALGLAIAFHAVIGGWATICIFIAMATEMLLTRSVVHLNLRHYSERQWLTAIGLFVLLAATGCVPPLLSNVGTPPEIVATANYVQVHQRLSHHLLFQTFPASHVGRFAILVVIWLFISRTVFISRKFQRLAWFCNSSLIISLLGIVLSGMAEPPNSMSGFANSLLRFYWFRFSDFAIPLGIGLFGVRLFEVLYQSPMHSQRIAASTSAAMFLLACLSSVFIDNIDLRAAADKAVLPTYADQPVRTWQTYENWRTACNWVRNNTRSDSVFLTPMEQQTFKWYAHRADFACWKDMPQDAASVVQWRKNVDIQRGIYRIGGPFQLTLEQLQSLSHDHGITHMLIPQSFEDSFQDSIPEELLSRIYPKDDSDRTTFVVYRFNE